MEIFVLTCINESKELVSVNAYDTLEKAQNAMLVSYQSELDSALEDLDDDDIEENNIEDKFAYLVVDKDDYAYYWDIRKTTIE